MLYYMEHDLIRISRLRRKRKTGRKKECCSCIYYKHGSKYFCSNLLIEESYNYKVCIHCVAERYRKRAYNLYIKDERNPYQTQYNMIGKVSDIVDRYYGNPQIHSYTDRNLRDVSYKSKSARFASMDGIFNLLHYSGRSEYANKYKELLVKKIRTENECPENAHPYAVIGTFTLRKSKQEVVEYLRKFEKETGF